MSTAARAMTPDPVMPTLIRPGEAPTDFASASTLITAEAQERPLTSVTGEPLPADAAVEIGCFDDATIFDLFAGRWTPLIGPSAPRANRGILPIRCGHAGEAPGCFSWCRTFFAGIDALPPAGRPLALRIHDHADPARAGFYNTVSHPSWWFREPRSPSPAFVFISLDEPGLSWESGSDGAHRTVLPAGEWFARRSPVLARALRALRRPARA